jgi:hypothetical protein
MKLTAKSTAAITVLAFVGLTNVQAQGEPKPVAAPAPGHGPISGLQLKPETFDHFRGLIRPSDGEYAWRQIRWHTDFWVVRKKAAAQDKPILVFWLDGAGYHDPLGLC